MGESLIAKRYAKALFKLHSGNLGEAKKYLDTLTAIKELFDEKKLRRVLTSPAMPNDLKREIIDFVAAKSAKTEDVKQFVKVVVDAGRVALFPAIQQALKNLIEEAEGVLEASVTTVVPIDQGDVDEIRKMLEKASGRKIVIEQKTDKAILGGLVVKIGNSLLDLSLRTKLDSIAQNAMR